LWDLVIRAKQLTRVTPLLEGVLSKVTGEKVETVDRRSIEPLPAEVPNSLA